jgi:hypothetical protein
VTSTIRRAAGGITVLEGVWIVFGYFAASPTSCPSGGCAIPWISPYLSPAELGLGVILIVVGGLGIWGASFAYLAGAILSFVTLSLMAYTAVAFASYAYLSPQVNNAVVGAALSLVGLIGNVLGVKSKVRLSEQANPMNLPVFG